jgi:hypothetical protein
MGKGRCEMTREDATDILIWALQDDSLIEGYQDKLNEALKMAIKALENHDTFMKYAYSQGKQDALSQEPCNDAIDRAEAMTEIMMFAGNVKSDEEDIYIKVSDAVQLLRELPPVTPKPETVTEFADRCRECGKMRKGHWIYDETIENWRCSKCNETPKTMGYVGTADFMAEHFKFCNHCGAKMESEDNE